MDETVQKVEPSVVSPNVSKISVDEAIKATLNGPNSPALWTSEMFDSISDGQSDFSTPDKGTEPGLKTFKSTLQAKKRLQAFSMHKQGPLPTSPLAKKDDKNDKKPTKKHVYPNDKARAVVMEIEELKRHEQAYLETLKRSFKRSRSVSSERGNRSFKKVDKRARNYRKSDLNRRSTTPDKKRKKSSTTRKKYPRNWLEFKELNLDFETLKSLDATHPKGNNNELTKQLMFEAPPLLIHPLTIKGSNREDKVVPFQFVSYTKTKPTISYSINHVKFKQRFLTRKEVLRNVSKPIKLILETFYENSAARFNEVNTTNKICCWFPKLWNETDNECKLIEKSVGLSFLQSYSGEDEDNEVAEEEPAEQTVENDESINMEDKTDLIVDESIKRSKIKKKSIESHAEKKNKKREKKKRKKLKNQSKTRKKRKHDADVGGDKEEKQKKEKKSILTEKETKIYNSTIDKEKKIEKVQKLDKEKRTDDDHCEYDKTKNRKRKSSEKDNNQDNNKIAKIEENTKIEMNFNEISIVKEIDELKNMTTIDRQQNNINPPIPKADEFEIESKPKDIENKEKSPDTDEYHSQWESDGEVTSSLPRRSVKPNRSWESDEELFERTYDWKTKTTSIDNLEIPLNINFTRKIVDFKLIDAESDMKLLEKEVESISEERKKLELKLMETKKNSESELDKRDDDFNLNKVKNEKADEFNLNHSSLDSNPKILENEYEEFMKAVSDSSILKNNEETSDSSSSSEKVKKRKKKSKKKTKKKFKLIDNLDELLVLPKPVPSPKIHNANLLVTNDNEENRRPFVFSSLTLPTKKLLDNSKLKLDDSDDDDDHHGHDKGDLKNKPNISLKCKEQIRLDTKKNEELDELIKNKEKVDSIVEKIEEKLEKKQELAKRDEANNKTIEKYDNNEVVKDKRSRSRTPMRSKDRKKEKDRRKSPKRSPKRRESPRRKRRQSPPRRKTSPRRRRFGSPFRRSPLRSLSPRRRSLSPRNRRRSFSRSPRRRTSISPSRRGSRKISLSPRRRGNSPINSPLDGFKRSVADSTISDDMLPQNLNEFGSPVYGGNKFYDRRRESSLSPKRIPLDDRINQVLGIDKNELKPLQTMYGSYNSYQQSYDNYQYIHPPPNYTNYNHNPDFVPQNFCVPPPSTTKIVQVGNILQVVPTEELPPPLLIDNKQESTQKIVQVGNMLQIVPGIIPDANIEKQSAESLMKQKNADRKAERDRRRLEREKRRKEKEKKRKEKEKRRQLKLKLKTENMIKRALQLEAEGIMGNMEEVEDDIHLFRPPIVVTTATSMPTKSILINLDNNQKKLETTKKTVQFADGIKPGEGTSPSGGEELSSPPPVPAKLPKRFKKIPKKIKKKKIKVKVVKKLPDEDYDDDDDLPPPSPPPGSPPPHVFPSRVKAHNVNNLHQLLLSQNQFYRPPPMILGAGGISRVGPPTAPYVPQPSHQGFIQHPQSAVSHHPNDLHGPAVHHLGSQTHH